MLSMLLVKSLKCAEILQEFVNDILGPFENPVPLPKFEFNEGDKLPELYSYRHLVSQYIDLFKRSHLF